MDLYLKYFGKWRSVIFLGVLALGVAHFSFATSKPSLSEDEISEAIDNMIAMRSFEDPKQVRTWVTSLGDLVPSVIMKKYVADHNVFHRIRMLNFLAYFSDANTEAFLKLAAEEAVNPHIQDAALQSLSIAQGAAVESYISKFTEHPNLTVRQGAQEAMTRIYRRKEESSLVGKATAPQHPSRSFYQSY